MKIFLVRHGIAVDLGEHGVKSDADRMLSTVGKRRVKDIALALKRLGAVPERIASSPLTRARETAEIFSNPDPAGVYPWPVTGETPVPFGGGTYNGTIGPAGMRFHDFESGGATPVQLEVVTTGSNVRIIVARLN